MLGVWGRSFRASSEDRKGGLGAAAISLGLALVVLCGGAGAASAQLPFGVGELVVQGARLTLYDDGTVSDADQTVDLGERAAVRTCFGGSLAECGTLEAGDPRVAGLEVRAELSGPELPEQQSLTTVPGGVFLLPGLQQAGDYLLENIRLVDIASGAVLGTSDPPLAVVRVREILLTSATVRRLSLDELRERGIALSEENFQAFDFAVGFAFDGETVELRLPLVYSGNGTAELIDGAADVIIPANIPGPAASAIRRWRPPRVLPFRMDFDCGDASVNIGESPFGDVERCDPDVGTEESSPLEFPLLGALVIPGTVSYLNQFFDVQVVVANGADAGTAVELADLQGLMRLPSGQVLRIAATEPASLPGRPVPLRSDSGASVIGPSGEVSGNWTVEGLVAGTHLVDVAIFGEMRRPGRETVLVGSRLRAAVEVVDARFNLTFTHPDTVRTDESYSLFVTVTNLSTAVQNLITVDLREQTLTGARPEDPADDLARTIDTLEPGASATVEFGLVAEVDGSVRASTFQSDSPAGQGTIQLVTGVGELGIPLSPATLVLPKYVRYLEEAGASPELVRRRMSLYGLAYSLAVAPSGRIPSGLPALVPGEVERRAFDLAEAGQRVFLGEALLESLESLWLDELGNRVPEEGFDALRRASEKGAGAFAALADDLRAQQVERSLAAPDLFDHLLDTMAHRTDFVSAMALPVSGSATPELIVREGLAEVRGVASLQADARVRTLAFASSVHVDEVPGGGDPVEWAMVGSVAPSRTLSLQLDNPTSDEARARVLAALPDPVTGRVRRVDFGVVTVPPASSISVALPLGASSGDLAWLTSDGSPIGGPPVAVAPVPLPPFRVLGAVQETRFDERYDGFGNWIRSNRYGDGLIFLFNRPPADSIRDAAGAFSMSTAFQGLDTEGEAAVQSTLLSGNGVFVQGSERVVAVRFSSAVPSMIDPSTGGPLVDIDLQVNAGAVVDGFGQSIQVPVPVPRLDRDPQHTGGLLTGKVNRGTGEAVVGAEVLLIRSREILLPTGSVNIIPDVAGRTTTSADGSYSFPFVEDPHWESRVLPGFRVRVNVPEGAQPEFEPATEREVSSRIRLQNRLHRVNVALLGRGSIRGVVRWADTLEPVAEVSLLAQSSLFQDVRTAVSAVDGTFVLAGVPVGPVTVSGRLLPDSGRAFQTVSIAGPGETAELELFLPRRPEEIPGAVVGRVLLRELDGRLAPAQNASVALTGPQFFPLPVTTDSLGRFSFADVPVGSISLQAADWTRSRTSAIDSFFLTAGETRQIELVLEETADRIVRGRVQFFDPFSNQLTPVEGAIVVLQGLPVDPAVTDENGDYELRGVPEQGVADDAYTVAAFATELRLEGSVELPPILGTTPEVVTAQTITLERARGGIDGVVLDPFGRPAAFTTVELYPTRETTTAADGSFSFDDVPVGTSRVTARIGDGLSPGSVGFLGEKSVEVVFGGHRPFVSVPMRGSGFLRVKSRTQSSPGVQSFVYLRPTYYSENAREIVQRGAYLEYQTDPNGDFQVEVPLGPYDLTVYNPFSGRLDFGGTVDYQGQVIEIDALFPEASTVGGTVLDVDGQTPVPGATVRMRASGLLEQTLVTDALGRFEFFLVPEGNVTLSAQAFVGSVERFGRLISRVTGPGEELDLSVRLEAQGTVRGRVLEQVNAAVEPLAFAEFYLEEGDYPNRRFPEQPGTYLRAGADGRFEISSVAEGRFQVVARDPGQVARRVRGSGSIDVDWGVVDIGDLVLSTSVGRLEVTVRDPASGAVVPDTILTLDGSESTVAGADGRAVFDALLLGTHRLYAFDAPTGRAGRLDGLQLTVPGQLLQVELFLDQVGEIRGTLWDDASLTVPVGGADVAISGRTTAGNFTARATTPLQGAEEGTFVFPGLPEGDYTLTAGARDSLRRARGAAALTPLSPIAEINLVLEQATDLWLEVTELLSAGENGLDPSDGSLTAVLSNSRIANSPYFEYQLLRTLPEPGTTLYLFPDVLAERDLILDVQENTGEQRTGRAAAGSVAGLALAGDGSPADPFRLQLKPKGDVRVTVVQADGSPAAGTDVTVRSGPTVFPQVTDEDGVAQFFAVPAGNVTAEVRSTLLGLGGASSGVLSFDDQTLDLAVTLQPSVRARVTVYQPVPNDVFDGDASTLVPAPESTVAFVDAAGFDRAGLTDDAGQILFEGLAVGAYSFEARNLNGEQVAFQTGTLSGPNDSLNDLAPVILDGGPPQIVSIVPPAGLTGVSRQAPVEIVFSEPIRSDRLPPVGGGFRYRLTSASGVPAVGSWSHTIDAAGRQVVRFVPSEPYENSTLYSLRIEGGPGGLLDRVGRQLTELAAVGSSFTTSDTVGPSILGTEPELDRPIPPDSPIRVDFSEAVTADVGELDGDGVDDAAVLFWQRDQAGQLEWLRLPSAISLTRQNYSVLVEPVPGLQLDGDTLQRRLVIDRLEDSVGNPVAIAEFFFRVYDDNAPQITQLPPPANAPGGQLAQGAAYELVPVLDQLDDVTPQQPGGDLARVDYFTMDPEQGPVAPVLSRDQYPFEFAFVASYVGDGVTPRPFPIWARAVDTSGNESGVAFVDLQVLPNSPPQITELPTANAIAPVAGTFYPGSEVGVSASGLSDPDGIALTLTSQLLDLATGAVLAESPPLAVDRPAGGWGALGPVLQSVLLPVNVPAGAGFVARVLVVDSLGTAASADSVPYTVAADAQPPQVTDLSAREALAGVARGQFFIGEQLLVRVRATDLETSVEGVEFQFEPATIFGAGVAAQPVGADLWQSAAFTVPPGVFSEATDVVVTAVATDRFGNTATSALTITVAPESDPQAPQITWTSPWPGASWPAGHTSPTGAGVELLLQVDVSDTNLDAQGDEIPGNIALVEFRGPVVAAQGGYALADEWTAAQPVDPAGDPGSGTYRAGWVVPNDVVAGQELPFRVRAFDTGGQVTEVPLRVVATTARRVYEGVEQAVPPSDAMLLAGADPTGPVFVLDGTTLSLLPQDDGSVRSLPSLILYAGWDFTAGTSGEEQPTRLTGPVASGFQSAVTHFPLQLGIEEQLAIGAGASVDMAGRGLLAMSGTDELLLPGMVRPDELAGGAHGGQGTIGYAANPQYSLPTRQTYGSVVRPRTPGMPGGYFGNSVNFGQPGGGVVELRASAAEVVLHGSIRADGIDGGSIARGGSAGGSIWLQAASVSGTGSIRADGGDGAPGSGNPSGGGGGGRIALEVGQYTDFEPRSQVSARGGIYPTSSRRGPRLGGAGTVYLALPGQDRGQLVLDNSGGGEGPGVPSTLPTLTSATLLAVDGVVAPGLVEVLLEADRSLEEPEGALLRWLDAADQVVAESRIVEVERLDPSLATPRQMVRLCLDAEPSLVGLLDAALGLGAVRAEVQQRFAAVELRGPSRLVLEDDLLVGEPGAEVLNDRAALLIDPSAAVALRGELPTIEVAATPDVGGEVLTASQVQASLTGAAAAGVERIAYSWSGDGASGTFRSALPPNDDRNVSLDVPAAAAAGAVTLEVEIEDAQGRVTTDQFQWTVLANEPPSGTVTVRSGTAPLPAGARTFIDVSASDRERLASILVDVSGPALGTWPQQRNQSSTSANRTFPLDVDPAADGSVDLLITVTVTDAGGLQTALPPLPVDVISNTPPTGTLTMTSGGPATVPSGATTQVTLQGLDAEGLASWGLAITGPVVGSSSRSGSFSGLDDEVTIDVQAQPAQDGSVDLQLVATVIDDQGNQTELAPLVIDVVAPAPTLILTATSSQALFPGGLLSARAEMADDSGLAEVRWQLSGVHTDLVTQTLSGTSSTRVYSESLPTTTLPGTATLTVTVTNDAGLTTVETLDYTVLEDTVAPTIQDFCVDLESSCLGGGFLHTASMAAGALEVASADQQVEQLSELLVSVSAFDNVGVVDTEIYLDGSLWDSTQGGFFSGYWTAPAVTAETDFVWEVFVTDFAGNVASDVRVVTVVPELQPSFLRVDCAPRIAALDGLARITVSAGAVQGIFRISLFGPTGSNQTQLLGSAPEATATFDVPLAGLGVGVASFTVEALLGNGLGSDTLTTSVDIDLLLATALEPDGGAANDWTALESEVVVLRSGAQLTIDQPRTFGGLVVEPDAVLTHSPWIGASEPVLDLLVNGPVSVQCGAAIDVSGRGYAPGSTHPSLATTPAAGTHLGAGSRLGNAAGVTYGSVYYPLEAGGGGRDELGTAAGGGVVRIAAQAFHIDGVIRSDGASVSEVDPVQQAGAGGSIWLVGDSIRGDGSISVSGGSVSFGEDAGGAGAISVVTGQAFTELPSFVATGGSGEASVAGAGTVALSDDEGASWILTVDNDTTVGDNEPPTPFGTTRLPALGSGEALSGSGGSVLVIDSLPADFFTGHWVELSDAAGTVKGRYQVDTILGDQLTLTANPSLSPPEPSVVPGDQWRGVYLFDVLLIEDSVRLLSDDLIETASATTSGAVELRRLVAQNLEVLGTLSHPSFDPGDFVEPGLDLEVGGSFTVGSIFENSPAGIDLVGRGYVFAGGGGIGPGGGPGGPGGAVEVPSHGSHLGLGPDAVEADAYGSVTAPRELGASHLASGGASFEGAPGGGSLRLRAASLLMSPGSFIDASGAEDGGFGEAGGAGGSVWIEVAGTLDASQASIVVDGGNNQADGFGVSGGGGAISLSAPSLASAPQLFASTALSPAYGGAGTIFTRDASSVFGDLLVDNRGRAGAVTVLPPLGSGAAAGGSGGAQLDTGQSLLPTWVEGRWIELRDGSGTLEGTWRVVTVAGGLLTLEPNAGESISVDPGDSWQAVYPFDSVTVQGGATLISSDPLLEGDVGGATTVDPSLRREVDGATPSARRFGSIARLVQDDEGLSRQRAPGTAEARELVEQGVRRARRLRQLVLAAQRSAASADAPDRSGFARMRAGEEGVQP